jgi:cysteine sulfinate desulfinase/cysteine desulfurase-like protein
MRFYLDHAATSPLRAEARDAWIATADIIGNASSTHGAGQDARRALEDARERIAHGLDCDPIEVVLTSGGTESINTALHGLWESRSSDADAVVLPDGEHHATMDTVAALAQSGAAVREVPLTELGRIDPGVFAEHLPGAALATALVANNEVGTVNDASGLSRAAAEARVPLHLDAVAALGPEGGRLLGGGTRRHERRGSQDRSTRRGRRARRRPNREDRSASAGRRSAARSARRNTGRAGGGGLRRRAHRRRGGARE